MKIFLYIFIFNIILFASINDKCKSCHKDIVHRIDNNIMNSMHGVLDVLRFQFKETNTINTSLGIKELKNIPAYKQTLAQNHFSKMCAACHIDQNESIFLSKGYTPRGGGCVDCHRVKLKVKSEELRIMDDEIHKSLSVKIPSKNCLKCHSNNTSNK